MLRVEVVGDVAELQALLLPKVHALVVGHVEPKVAREGDAAALEFLPSAQVAHEDAVGLAVEQGLEHAALLVLHDAQGAGPDFHIGVDGAYFCSCALVVVQLGEVEVEAFETIVLGGFDGLLGLAAQHAEFPLGRRLWQIGASDAGDFHLREVQRLVVGHGFDQCASHLVELLDG